MLQVQVSSLPPKRAERTTIRYRKKGHVECLNIGSKSRHIRAIGTRTQVFVIGNQNR